MPAPPFEPGPGHRRPVADPGATTGCSATWRAVEAALPVVRAHVADGERDRRLSDDVVQALRATGINRLLLPEELGGYDAPVTDIMDIGELIATVDGSAAWCAIIGAGSNLFAGYMPLAGARRVFADADQGNATMVAPAGTLTGDEGGYRLSGRWPFTSNCLHGAWVGLGAVVEAERDSAPAPRLAFVRAADLEVDDTWDAPGLRATGSHDVVAHDLDVDADRCCVVVGGRPWATGRLWRIPIYCTFVPLLACVALGVARSALDEVAREVRSGRSARRGKLVDDPIGLAELGTADARLRAARAGLHAAVREAHDAADRHEPVAAAVQARVCLSAQEASDIAVEATSVAHRLGGGAAAYGGTPLLHALGDVHAIRQHQMLGHRHRGEIAKALAGLDSRYPPFVV